jgi:hypothetical protein
MENAIVCIQSVLAAFTLGMCAYVIVSQLFNLKNAVK